MFRSCCESLSHPPPLSSPRLSVGPAPDKAAITIGQYLRQLSRHRNFLWFVSMNLIQVKHGRTSLMMLGDGGGRWSCDRLDCQSPVSPCRCFTATSTTTSSLSSWSTSSPTTSRPPPAPSCWVKDLLGSCCRLLQGSLASRKGAFHLGAGRWEVGGATDTRKKSLCGILLLFAVKTSWAGPAGFS